VTAARYLSIGWISEQAHEGQSVPKDCLHTFHAPAASRAPEPRTSAIHLNPEGRLST
jgi:hypothetical protein